MIHGILNVYKERGYTSHDVVARLRGIVGQRKIGHTGTLDPEAEGVLPVCLGKATKLCDMITDTKKTYEAVLLLGVATDTQDMTGRVLGTGDVSSLTPARAEQAALSYIGDYEQVPPMFSALKVNGKKLYELAREGKEIERKPRTVHIYDVKILDTDLPRVRMEVVCSKGTYIRTLCHDIGAKLGCGGSMEKLLRTSAGGFAAADSLKLDQIERSFREGESDRILYPVDYPFSSYQRVVVREECQKSARNGNPFPADGVQSSARPFDHGERVRLYDMAGNFIGIFLFDEAAGKFTAVKMFYTQV